MSKDDGERSTRGRRDREPTDRVVQHPVHEKEAEEEAVVIAIGTDHVAIQLEMENEVRVPVISTERRCRCRSCQRREGGREIQERR